AAARPAAVPPCCAAATSWRQHHDLCRKQVAVAPDRLEQSGTARIRLQLLAQAADLGIDAAIEYRRLFALRQVEKTGAAQHPVGILDQHPQQMEFRRAQGHADGVGIAQLAQAGIEYPAVEGKALAFLTAVGGGA